MRYILIAMLILFVMRSAWANEREMRLFQVILCPVCQGQTIAESDATISILMRKEIHMQIAEGKSDEEITAYLIERYGEGVVKKDFFAVNILYCTIYFLLFLYLIRVWWKYKQEF